MTAMWKKREVTNSISKAEMQDDLGGMAVQDLRHQPRSKPQDPNLRPPISILYTHLVAQSHCSVRHSSREDLYILHAYRSMTHPTTYIEAYPLGEVPPAKLTQAEIDRKPWKYIGYQGFSEFVASDDDFFVLRRFGVLSARVLLALQDRLSELEEELQTLDAMHSLKTAADAHNGSFRQDTHPERRELVLSIYRNLREYNELVIQCSQIRARPKVPQKDITSISNWFYNNHNAILDKEAAYIEHPTDLFSLVPKVKSPLRALLERSQRFRLLSLWRKSPTGLNHHDQGNVHYSSDNRIERFVSTIVAFLGVVMLISPLWILAFVTDTVSRLTIITAFLLVFWALLALTTVAKSFESLGAAAAYAAVLVVFLQITGHPL